MFRKESKKKHSEKQITIEKVLSFLKPDKWKISLFIVIIIIHFLLGLGFAFFDHSYWVFISILYAIFNFPLFITPLTLGPYCLSIINNVIILLIAHLIYWYIVACSVQVPITTANKTLRYKYSLYIVSAFLAFGLLFALWFSLLFGNQIFLSDIRF